MMQHWLKPKCDGYGATPLHWQGWVATLVFAALVSVGAFVLAALQQNLGSTQNDWAIVGWVVIIAIVTMDSVRFARAKIDGEWGWRWGK